MRKRLQVLILAFLLLSPTVASFATSSVSAASLNLFDGICNGPDGNKTGTDASQTDICNEEKNAGKGKTNPVITGLKIAITITSIIVGISSVIVLIISGMNMITANGDAQKVAKARTSIIYALVGLVVTVLAVTVVAFVLNKV